MTTAHAGRFASSPRLPPGRLSLAGLLLVLYVAGCSPDIGSFTPAGSLITPRDSHTATLLADGRVLIVGGVGDVGDVASAELYDPKTGTFSPTGSMAAPRASFTATLLSDGRVLVAGGVNDSSPLASAELYDPKTGRFDATASMSTARGFATATQLFDGRVLIVGGCRDCGSSPPVGLPSAEVFDNNTGSFSSAGSMSTARFLNTTTALPDHRVLVVGGYGDSARGSAELYQPQTR